MHFASCLAKKLNTFVRLTERELKALAEVQSESVLAARGVELLHQGEPNQFAYILQSGWGCSFKILANGGRQIVTFPVPGDIVGLRGLLLRTSDHAFSLISDAVVSRIEVPRLLALFNEFPHLGEAVLWATSRDEAITVEHLSNIGRRNAVERTAHFLLELGARLRLVGLAEVSEFACPLTQTDLADALGLSAIHVNRVLRNLREHQLLTFKDQMVTIHDRPGLKSLAGYEDIEENAVLLRDVAE